MCGITGFWQTKDSLNAAGLTTLINAMSDQISTRGPDDAGGWVCAETGIALGHRRLSIVDLSPAGHQPMVSACGRYVMIYNGEIYNAPEIREKILTEKPITFQGTSDTEVLLEGCALWGVKKLVQFCIGMFAFALYDRQHKTVTLVRDRLGIKPLYWGMKRSTLFFGSQPKSFRPHPHFDGALNHEIIPTYIRYGCVPAPYSIYHDIRQLEPGHLVVIQSDLSYQQETYWALEHHLKTQKAQKPYETLITDLEALLSDAVKRRMVADVPLGAFLSGGIDSSLVVALMQKQSSKPIKTFTIGFDEAEYNEAHHAKAVAQHLGTDHHELYLSVNEAADLVTALPQWYDEPFADSSQIPTYLVSKIARNQVTVSLSGDGGDELFAGYSRYTHGQKVIAYWNLLPTPLKKAAAQAIFALSQQQWSTLSKYIFMGQGPQFMGRRAHKLGKLLQQPNVQSIYSSLASQIAQPLQYVNQEREISPLKSLKTPQDFDSLIEYMMYVDTKTYLPNDILTKVDRASMALGLEARVPLLDHRVVEFAQHIPLSQKIINGQGKAPLRDILAHYVPRELFERPKTGFGIPIHQWLRGRLRDWAEELLSEKALKESAVFDVKQVRQLWQGYLKNTNDEAYGLWNFLMFQAWYQEYQK
jgi:asparagine synthase (glutamine-hydrolysing)